MNTIFAIMMGARHYISSFLLLYVSREAIRRVEWHAHVTATVPSSQACSREGIEAAPVVLQNNSLHYEHSLDGPHFIGLKPLVCSVSDVVTVLVPYTSQ